MNEEARSHRVDLHVDRLHVLRGEDVAAQHVEQRVERRMRGGAGWIQFHGDAGVEDFPAAAEVGERLGKR